jgi:Fe-S oxidoreductase
MFGFRRDAQLPLLSNISFGSWIKQNSDYQRDNFYWFGHKQLPVVVLWIDTFNNYYAPKVLEAGLKSLIKSGFRVAVPKRRFCCGRPLYEHGFLVHAKQQLEEILDHFHPQLPAATEVIVLEPSCLSVFKDELVNLMHSDPRAHDLSKRMTTLIDFLSRQGIAPQKKFKSAILHLHCHHKSLSPESKERSWLSDCFEDLQEPENGCCGMAGSFGIKRQTREISEFLYRRKLKPTIDASQDATILVANGISCREQIARQSQREVLHSAQIVERCLVPVVHETNREEVMIKTTKH